MKKLTLLLVLLVFPVIVNAASTPTVTKLEATVNENTINYTGEIESGSYAVMCKLNNSSDEEVDLFSSAVDSNKFEGQFTNVPAGKYTVVCANYEGGDVKKVEATVEKNPKTHDSGIVPSAILLIISVVGIIGFTIYMKKANNN